MIETHAFGIFVPPNAKYLILGSFNGKQAMKGTSTPDASYDWFYGTKRNQFWPIFEEVYGCELRDIFAKKKLFTLIGFAIADIIHNCERRNGSNLDANLINIEYNIDAISSIFDHNQIEKIFFTSVYVEKRYKKYFKKIINHYPNAELITLPSPSPRYAKMSKEKKIIKYKELLPKGQC